MLYLVATMRTSGITTATHIQDHVTEIKSNPDRGSTTYQQIWNAIGLVLLVGALGWGLATLTRAFVTGA